MFPFWTLAQSDSLGFSFEESIAKLNQNQRAIFTKLIKDKRVHHISVKAYVGDQGSISKNRLVVEYRIRSLIELFVEHAIYENIVSIERVITNDSANFNKIKLNFEFIEPKKERVIFKTATVEITERAPALKIVPKVLKRKAPQEKRDVIKDYGVLKIEDFKKGAKIVIPNLLFEATRHTLYRSSYSSLRNLLAILEDKPTLIVQLQGHICCKKNGDDGMDFGTGTGNLSENRAKAVYDFLVKNGIARERLSFRGFGSKYKLVDDGGSAIKGLINRRVEVFVISE